LLSQGEPHWREHLINFQLKFEFVVLKFLHIVWQVVIGV
jgi:hypothetical protein